MRLFILNSKSCRVKLPLCHFYPRPPWGGRLFDFHRRDLGDRFLSTPSVGRATHIRQHIGCTVDISIRALRGEGDKTAAVRCHKQLDFYPRPPWGGRPRLSSSFPAFAAFLSTPSVGRATAETQTIIDSLIFLSTPSVGRATKAPPLCLLDTIISIHALRGEGD